MTSATSPRGYRERWFVPVVAGALTLTLGIGPAGAALPVGPATEHTASIPLEGDVPQEGARELVAMSANGAREVYVGRGTSQGVFLTDRNVPGQSYQVTAGSHFNPAISGDGKFIAYVVYGSTRSVYVMNVTDPANPGPAVLASKSTSGQASNGLSDFPSLDFDGNVIAFHSTATNLDPLVPPPSSGGPTKVYVRDLAANLSDGTTEMVSVDNSGAAQAGNAVKPDLSDDGNEVVFASEADLAGPPAGTLAAMAATPAAPGGGGGGGGGGGADAAEEETTTVTQVWVRDRSAETTTIASTDSDGVPGNAGSALVYGPTISADGTIVAFESDATNLVAADTNARTDAFHHDMTTVDTTRVSERTPFDEFGAFHAVTPDRVLDTRIAADPVGQGETITVPIADIGEVPADAVAVAVNITVDAPTTSGFLTAWPAGDDRPTASTINFTPGLVIANAATMKLGDDGAISIYNFSGSTHVIVDVAGWYDGDELVAGGGFIAMPPVRALDTRTTGAPLGNSGVVEVPVAGVLGVPADATAVALSLTVDQPTTPGFLTAWPTGEDQPLASNLNFAAGDTVANSVVVKVGDAGTVSIYNLFASANVIVDVLGWFDAGLPNGGFTSLTPTRVLDTRTSGTKVSTGTPAELKVIDVADVPAVGVTSVALNVTVTEPTTSGFLTVFPTGTPQPLASNQNFVANETIAVQVLAQVGADGKVSLAVGPGLSAHLVVDVVGWYSGVQVSEGGLGAVVSGDGEHVGFESLSTTLTEGDVNGVIDAFVRDLSPALTERVSVVDETLGGTEATGTRTDGNTGETVAQKNGADVAVSADGSMIAFTSNGNLTNDRVESEEEPGAVSTEPAIFTRTRETQD